MAASLILSDSARGRYMTGAVMYFAQGIPSGLMHIAIPAWLASKGVGAGEIASYLAVIVLPWALKVLSGPLMDRFEFLPMGRRKPWVFAAQLGMTLSFLGLMLVDQPAEQLGALMILGVLINVFAATQDVAVDGMSIDLTPVEQQGRLNAFMAFGKAAGWGISSAVSGVLLVSLGLPATALVAAMASGAICLAFGVVRERAGERRFPWSAGRAVSEPRGTPSLKAVLKGLNAVLWTRVSTVLMLVMFLDGLVGGYGHALMPIAAVKLFGFTTPEWSQLVAVMGLIGAGIALAFGPLIDRFGAKRMLLITVALVAVHALLLAQTQYLWKDTLYVRSMLAVWIMMGPVTMVCMIALAMAICATTSSATQFAVYMSIANLGSSAGSKLYGSIAEGASYHEAFLLLCLLTIIMIMALAFHRHRRGDVPVVQRKAASRYTVGFGIGGAGTYWSGAIRCPKCRADMETLEVDGVEIDRCLECGGLWFDAGEMEKLKSRRIAEAVDIGDSANAAAHNRIDRYGCPRCGGHMVRMVDARQRHIWYEKCSSCHGSYLDAGEFLDLSTRTISDLLKRFRTPARD
ncbi:MAG: MFS transporter [Gammaproteobacteria bacterium]